MSIFTKIFVVLVMVLSVLLAALVVPFVVNTDTYRENYLNAQSQLEVQKYNAANRENDLSAQIQDKVELINQHKDEIARLQAELNSRDTQIQGLQAQVIQLQNANADVRGQLARLSTGLDQATQINAMLQEEIKDRRDKMLTLQTRGIELTESLRDRTTQVDTLVRQVRLLKEQQEDLTTQNETLVAKVESLAQYADKAPATAGGLDMKVGPGSPSSTTIRGMITDVKQIGDDQFIAINVGANDKVAEGMKFMIHQGDTYLGDAVITQVDLNSAAGRVTLKRGEISPNSEVLAGNF
ncbi:hypothetical protein HED60_24405 [Planctomycetales bacterium ZRK34]|nr:hypothetical protein HED60_24405 [Planctomycetales bacterium ZRK34]